MYMLIFLGLLLGFFAFVPISEYLEDARLQREYAAEQAKKAVEKAAPKAAEPQYSTEYRTESHEVGKTEIQYTLEDGRMHTEWVYGKAQGNIYGWEENYLQRTALIYTSLDLVKSLIRGWDGKKVSTFTNDPEKPTEAIIGRVVEIKVLRTEPHTATCEMSYEVLVSSGKEGLS